MGRIMISWGIVATLTAFVSDGASLVAARILLGVGEAGFFPGVIYLLACWFPEGDRGRAMSVFMLGIFGPVAVGAAKDAGSLEAGLGVLACVLLLGAARAARLPFAATRGVVVEPSAA